MTITGYNQTDPANFSLLYEADLAGSLQLLPPTNATANMSLTRQVQPADSLALKFSLNVSNFLVETENFTSYTEKDDNGHITVTSSRCTVAGLARNEDAWVYDDKGADYFDGDFDHFIDVYYDAGDIDGTFYFWMLSNSVDDWRDIRLASGDALSVNFIRTTETDYLIRLIELVGGDYYIDDYFCSLDTPYYLKVKRDESVGTYGRLYCYIYNDTARTSLLDTLQLDLHEKEDFQYIFVVDTSNNGEAPTIDGYCENLHLQEAVGTVSLTGEDKDGNAQTETVTVSANTTYTTAKWYKSIDSQGVDCTGTFTLAITQGRWGIIWNEGNSYTTKGVKIDVGDGSTETWYADENVQIQIYPSSTISYFFKAKNNSHLRLGKLLNETDKISSNGISIKSFNCWRIFLGESGSATEIYDSYIAEIGSTHYGKLDYLEGSNITIYNTKLSKIWGLTMYGVSKIYDVVLQDVKGVEWGWSALATIEGIRVCEVDGNCIYITDPSFDITITDFYGRHYMYDLMVLDTTVGNDVYLVNADVDVWTFDWSDCEDTEVYRQYTFDLATNDGANVTLVKYTDPITEIGSWITPSNGSIPQQTLTKCWYNETYGNVAQEDVEFGLTITKDGYQTYAQNFTLSEKTDWTITLQSEVTDLGDIAFVFALAGIGLAVIAIAWAKKREPEPEETEEW